MRRRWRSSSAAKSCSRRSGRLSLNWKNISSNPSPSKQTDGQDIEVESNMTDEGPKPIIVERVKKSGAHHGGAWKIAYADFVTAMMAFFLLMWLLGSTAKGDLQGIAEYFKTPLKVAMSGGTGSGDSSSVLQ